jgi:hypothetical protein
MPYFVSDELCASVRDDQIHDPLRAKGVEPSPNSYRRVVDCFPSDESVTIAWRTRNRALALMFGVPIAAFVLGYGLLWSFKGFNRGGIERASGDKGKTMVSGFFETKPSSETAMDALIRMTYGSVLRPKTAVLEEAVALAHRDLLGETVVHTENLVRAGMSSEIS